MLRSALFCFVLGMWLSPGATAAPVLPNQAAQVSGFVPGGWRLEQQQNADFNGDARQDVLLVLRQTDPSKNVKDSGYNANPRLLVAAFKRAVGGYTLAFQSNIIPVQDSPNMDDPLDLLTLRPGGFRLTFTYFASMGSWTTFNTTYTVRFQDGCFRVIGFDRSELVRNSGEISTLSVNYLTAKAKVATGNISSDQLRERWLTLLKNPKLCIQDIQNGFEYQPDLPK